jgi:hypothetical protein
VWNGREFNKVFAAWEGVVRKNIKKTAG